MKKILKYGVIVAIAMIIILNLTKVFSIGINLNEKTGVSKNLAKTAEYIVDGIPSDSIKPEETTSSKFDYLKNLKVDQNSNDIEMEAGEVEVSFIDVGQGDCILITDAGRCMLIDTGNKDSYKAIEEYLHGKGINTVDVLVITHPDLDHIGSSVLLLAEFDIPTIYIPDVEGKSRDYTMLMSATRKRNTEVINPVCGLPITFGTANYTIYCTNNIEYEDTNSYSLIVKMVNGEDSFLFTGDATGEETDKIIADGYDLSAKVLKAAHHGSANCGCNSESFIKAVNPEGLVISCGLKNEYGHPHLETMELAKQLGLNVYRTDTQGTLEFVSTGLGIKSPKPTDDYRNGNNM